jgi:hypothetical protein
MDNVQDYDSYIFVNVIYMKSRLQPVKNAWYEPLHFTKRIVLLLKEGCCVMK